MFCEIDKVMKKLNETKNFRYGRENGRMIETLRMSIIRAMNEDKVGVILTKNKEQFLKPVEYFCEVLDLECEITRKSYDIIRGNTLLVKIVESLDDIL